MVNQSCSNMFQLFPDQPYDSHRPNDEFIPASCGPTDYCLHDCLGLTGTGNKYFLTIFINYRHYSVAGRHLHLGNGWKLLGSF